MGAGNTEILHSVWYKNKNKSPQWGSAVKGGLLHQKCGTGRRQAVTLQGKCLLAKILSRKSEVVVAGHQKG